MVATASAPNNAIAIHTRTRRLDFITRNYCGWFEGLVQCPGSFTALRGLAKRPGATCANSPAFQRRDTDAPEKSVPYGRLMWRSRLRDLRPFAGTPDTQRTPTTLTPPNIFLQHL